MLFICDKGASLLDDVELEGPRHRKLPLVLFRVEEDDGGTAVAVYSSNDYLTCVARCRMSSTVILRCISSVSKVAMARALSTFAQSGTN